MEEQTFTVHTLHRSRYMFSFVVLLFFAGGVSALLPFSEIVKIIAILFTIPIILYSSVKWSQRPSLWTITDTELTISFPNKTVVYPRDKIDHIRCLTRSGGNLYVIYLQHKSPDRYWRNKLFQGEDDQIALQKAFLERGWEFYKL